MTKITVYIMIGPVANDDTMVTVNRFVQGIYTADEAIIRLRYSKANDQVAFHTELEYYRRRELVPV